MTTVLTPTTTPSTGNGSTGLRVTQVRVLLSEWTKFRSLRSTVSTLLIAVVVMIGLGAMFAAITASQATGFESGATAISTSLTGTFFAQLAVGVLGVLLITGEYSTGMIRSSLTVVPSRLPMLWGKLAVFAGTVFLTMLAASFTSFFVGQALLSGHHLDASLSDPGALRAVFGAGTVSDGGRAHRDRDRGVAPQHRRRDHHLRRGVLRVPTADQSATNIFDRPLRAVPTVQRRRSAAGRHFRCRQPPDSLDWIYGDVRLRSGPHRTRRMAALPRRRLTGTSWELAGARCSATISAESVHNSFGFSLDRDDDLAACVSCFDVSQCRRRVGQRVGPVDDGAQGAGVDQFGHGEQVVPAPGWSGPS